MALHTEIRPTNLVRSADMGCTTTVCGVTLNTRVSSADTAGAFALIEATAAPYCDGLAPHWHAYTTEVIYVLNGTLACTLGDVTTTASPGTAILIPPRVVHTIWNPTAVPATYLIWCSPGGFERYCEAWATRVINDGIVSPAMQHLCGALAHTYDVLTADTVQSDGQQPD